MSRTYIQPDQIDLTILDKISEEDVQHWLAAKLHQLREGFSIMNTLDISTTRYDDENKYGVSVTVHGGGECVVSEPNIATAVKELNRKLTGYPHLRAMEKRASAAQLLHEAEELDKLSSDAPASVTA